MTSCGFSGYAFSGGAGRHDWLGQGDANHAAQGAKDVLERAAISGDYVDGDGKEDGPITVTGRRNVSEDIGGNYGAGFYPGGTGDTGGGSAGPTQITEDAKDTPCVDEVPAGVTRDQVNDLAKGIAGTLGSRQDSTGWEWGAFIFRAPDGQLYQSAPFTAGHPDDMNGAIGRVPSGSTIVGYIHTHPIDMLMDQRMVSAADRSFITNLMNAQGNFQVDPNMLVYITTKDLDQMFSSDTYSTFVYDKSRRTATHPGCDL